MFPRAVAANHALFHDADGVPRGAGELYRMIAAAHERARAVAPSAAPAFAEAAPLAFARDDGQAFHGFFRTDTTAGPISGAVASLWSTPPGGEGASPGMLPDGAVGPAQAAVAEVRARRAAQAGPLDLSAFMRATR